MNLDVILQYNKFVCNDSMRNNSGRAAIIVNKHQK